jgi:hypothetical protein
MLSALGMGIKNGCSPIIKPDCGFSGYFCRRAPFYNGTIIQKLLTNKMLVL